MLISGQNSEALLAAASGDIPGLSVVNKFGRAPSGIQTTATDIWASNNQATRNGERSGFRR